MLIIDYSQLYHHTTIYIRYTTLIFNVQIKNFWCSIVELLQSPINTQHFYSYKYTIYPLITQ
ncbi:hypothetical protein [Psilogramma increta granulovirus]|uniref:Uncharacterized protein n=1 Tax=Psilogramma increta granulovirus TaxID=2953508 RepID=A0A977TNT7_9BBAC|nr:hypothetical protein [Psilogramma increta granulovirus]